MTVRFLPGSQAVPPVCSASTVPGEQTGSDGIRVVLVDQHPLFRAGTRLALDGCADVKVVGEAEDTRGGARAIAHTAPDVVVVDLQLPDDSGLRLTRLVAANHPRVAVMVMTTSADDDTIVDALRAGARGFLLKRAGRDEVTHAVRLVAQGGAAFSSPVAERLAALVARPGATPASPCPFPTLSPREREVLDLVARGYDNRRIARQLYLSDKTVRNYVSGLFAKLQAPDRAALIVRAREAGMGRQPERAVAAPATGTPHVAGS